MVGGVEGWWGILAAEIVESVVMVIVCPFNSDSGTQQLLVARI